MAEKDEVKSNGQRDCGDGLNLGIALVEDGILDDGKQVYAQKATPLKGGRTPQEVSDASMISRVVKHLDLYHLRSSYIPTSSRELSQGQRTTVTIH